MEIVIAFTVIIVVAALIFSGDETGSGTQAQGLVANDKGLTIRVLEIAQNGGESASATESLGTGCLWILLLLLSLPVLMALLAGLG